MSSCHRSLFSVSFMMRATLLLGLSLFFMSFCSAHSEEEDTSLELVIVVTRHGARTPYTIMPPKVRTVWDCQLNPISIFNVGYSSELGHSPSRLYRKVYISGSEPLAGNCSQGQLTTQGALEHHALGVKFRKHYVDTGFLPSTLSPQHVYLRSTDITRTIESAQSQMMGMFPPSSSSSTHIANIETLEASVETLTPHLSCPVFTQWCNDVQMGDAWQAKLSQYLDLKSTLARAWDARDDQMPFWVGLYNEFVARQYHGLAQPPLVNESIIYDQVGELVGWQMGQLYNQHANYTSLAIGVFFDELVSLLSSAVTHGTAGQPQFRLYSAHDITCGLVLSGLGIYEGEWPRYASNIVIELHRKGDQHYVKVIYNDVEKTLPNCSDSMCPFSTVKSNMEKIALSASKRSALCNAVPAPKPLNEVTQNLC